MILQHILFPREGICKQTELFFHSEKETITCQEDHLFLPKGLSVRFLSYFNAFSIEKWQEYTDIRQFKLSVRLQGSCVLLLCRAEITADTLSEKILSEIPADSTEPKTYLLTLPKEPQKGVCYFCLKAIKDTVFYGGEWLTDEESKNTVNLAAGICTYRRETFITKTLQTIRESILENDASPLAEHFQVFVSDNGNTLPLHTLNSDKIHVYYNKNTGGAGGFGRCMLEAADRQEAYGFTHILLMDDDIILETESLYRTYTLLSYVKKRYQGHILGGGLLRLDRPYIQHANGEQYDSGIISSSKRNYDLRQEEYVVKNEAWLPIDHSGWWYACIPMNKHSNQSFPLPLFIHCDDIEYSLRYNGNIMTLNGISVWHDAFDNRKNSVTEYYDMRNALICNAIHHPEYTAKKTIKIICRHLTGQLLRFRYADQALTLKAVEDFCKGVDFFKQTNPLTLHEEIMKMGYPQENVSSLLKKYQMEKFYKKPKDTELYPENRFSLKEKLTLNGWLLPAKKQCIPIPFGAHPKKLYRLQKVLFFDPDTQKGILVKRQHRQLIFTLGKCFKVCRLVQKNYAKTTVDYQEHYRELTTKTFWRQYLDLS